VIGVFLTAGAAKEAGAKGTHGAVFLGVSLG
jgi:hypothetical protein